MTTRPATAFRIFSFSFIASILTFFCCLWLAGCAGPGLFNDGKVTPPFSNPTLTILGARIVSGGGTAADGRAVRIDSNSSNKVKLANCVLIASSAATESIYAATSNTKVHLLNGAAANKDVHANVGYYGGAFAWNAAIT